MFATVLLPTAYDVTASILGTMTTLPLHGASAGSLAMVVHQYDIYW